VRSTYHSGELEVQARAGVLESAGKIGRSIRDALPPAAQQFLREQRVVIVATVDGQGAVWASLLSGAAGFIEGLDERALRIAATPNRGDPLGENLARPGAVGLLAIDFATRSRIRVNGTGQSQADGGILVHVRQAYGNCPKYIHPRRISSREATFASSRVQRGATLTPAQQALIKRSDTFFVASSHSTAGADATHRGGDPGFVRVVDSRTLAWPDYPGNTMFQTLGNIAAEPAAGLLFVDFERGTTLQLTGTARILWDEGRGAINGTARRVEFRIALAIEIEGASPLRWQPLEPQGAAGVPSNG
jgi:predicted pyridoxine 5'-phosphate oxidase superfamily flavin-nucleotide-binding protein